MNSKAASRAWFKSLLHEEGLDDFDQFFEIGFFDEIPFYSRYSQLKSLELLGPDLVNDSLLNLSLDYLDSLLTHREPDAPFFAALTVTRDDLRSPILPALFCCCGDLVDSLSDQLNLIRPESALAKYLSAALDSSLLTNDLEIFQDSMTVPGDPRIFIGHQNLPSVRILRLSDLATNSKANSKKPQIYKPSIKP